MKYYSIMEHNPQCKEPLTLNLEKKKKSSKSHETKKYLAKQGQECSPQGIFLLKSAHLFKNSQGKREAQLGHINPTLLRNPHAHLCTCGSQLIMLP